jgi:hypothetical protein
MNMAREQSDHGAFMEKLLLQPSLSLHQLPLHALTFAVKDMSVLITLFQLYYLSAYQLPLHHSSLSSRCEKF